MTRRIGWIGLGDQGAPMARALAASDDIDLHVWARREASLGALEGLPFTRQSSPRELASSVDTLVVCLREDSDIESLFSEHDLWSAITPGSAVINHGTGLPRFARQFAAIAAEHGVDSLDAPVSGGRAGAEARRLLTMVGGEAPAFDRAREVFAHYSASVVHAGSSGAGQMAKLMNNALLMLNQRSVQEIFSLARSIGLEVPSLAAVLRNGTGSSVALEVLGSAVTVDNAEHLSRLQIIDMDLFDEALFDAGSPAPLISERARSGAANLHSAAADMLSS